MSDLRKIFRTAAYKIGKDGHDHVFFWSIDPAYGEPGFYVREHDLYAKGSTSTPITKALPEKEALGIVEEIERDTARKYPQADDTYKDHRWIGSNYRDAPLLINHPLREAEKTQQVLKDLKARKPPGLRLKP